MSSQRFQSALAWLSLAALCGLTGFVLVYHYASHERPVQHFAIVIDAGSTQTRSSLFSIEFDERKLAHHQQAKAAAEADGEPLPLARLLRVRQLSSCVNGGPLASVAGLREAQNLIESCLIKFTGDIRQLKFANDDQQQQQDQEASFFTRQLASLGKQVNSVTHLYLGATAGMRALSELNETKASQKLRWIEEAIGRSNEFLERQSPYVNSAYVGIISGIQEAAFGWLSVNFLAETLKMQPTTSSRLMQSLERQAKSEPVYTSETHESKLATIISSAIAQTLTEASIGTLELGGASAQLAMQANGNSYWPASPLLGTTMQASELQLFGKNYQLATRSDLCLGMSQAVLRLQHILLQARLSEEQSALQRIELTNACMQRGARLQLARAELARLSTRNACLVPSLPVAGLNASELAFKRKLAGLEQVVFIGEGDANKCDALLETLVEPRLCSQHFSLCPKSKLDSSYSRQLAENRMPFVTISGYNHALNVLDLAKADKATISESELIIEQKLGGSSVNYNEFLTKTQQFCQTNLAELRQKYPKVGRPYEAIVCLQLVYIKKLLTQFYQFQPTTSWSQIKFLIFEPQQEASSAQQVGDPRRDIGWTLGLLLNATSEQLAVSSAAQLNKQQVFFHHGATLDFVIRSTLIIMVACCLIAISLLVVGIIEARQAQRRLNIGNRQQDFEALQAARFYTLNSGSPRQAS